MPNTLDYEDFYNSLVEERGQKEALKIIQFLEAYVDFRYKMRQTKLSHSHRFSEVMEHMYNLDRISSMRA